MFLWHEHATVWVSLLPPVHKPLHFVGNVPAYCLAAFCILVHHWQIENSILPCFSPPTFLLFDHKTEKHRALDLIRIWIQTDTKEPQHVSRLPHWEGENNKLPSFPQPGMQKSSIMLRFSYYWWCLLQISFVQFQSLSYFFVYLWMNKCRSKHRNLLNIN